MWAFPIPRAPSSRQWLRRPTRREPPDPFPYESPRYRAWADLNHDGYISGPAELMPLYLAAAKDFTQPIFQYGPPRLFRLGVELEF